MSINGVGTRKIALFLNTSHVNVINWIRNAHKVMQEALDKSNADYSEKLDIIEFDEIYTFVEKRGSDTRYGLLTLGTQSVLLRL